MALRRQGKARDTEMQAGAQQEGESLARVLAGLGIDADPATASAIAGNKDLMQEILERSRPPEPVESTPEKMFGSARQYSLGDESQWARGPSERDDLWEQGYRPYQEQAPEPVAQAPQPQSLSKATGPDGKEYWVDPRNPTAPPVPVFPGMQAQQEAPPAEASSGRPPGARVSELESKAIQAADRVGNSLEILTGQTEDGQRLFDSRRKHSTEVFGRNTWRWELRSVGRLPAVPASVSGCVSSAFTA